MSMEFRRVKRRKPMAEINVVPYIDVMLVLLVVFMVTAPLLMQGVEVELPEASTEPLDDQDDEPLIVSIKADGTYYINLGGTPEAPVERAKIGEMVSKVLKAKPETQVLVWGDRGVEYGVVVQLMGLLQKSGADGVGLVTENPQP